MSSLCSEILDSSLLAKLLIINLRQTEALNCAGQKALSGARTVNLS